MGNLWLIWWLLGTGCPGTQMNNCHENPNTRFTYGIKLNEIVLVMKNFKKCTVAMQEGRVRNTSWVTRQGWRSLNMQNHNSPINPLYVLHQSGCDWLGLWLASVLPAIWRHVILLKTRSAMFILEVLAMGRQWILYVMLGDQHMLAMCTCIYQEDPPDI